MTGLYRMIVEPEQRVADFIKAGSDIVSVHAEQSATIHLHRLVNNVRSLSIMLTPAYLKAVHAAPDTAALTQSVSVQWKLVLYDQCICSA